MTIEIPEEGEWNAVTCATLGAEYVVLENFRVHPFCGGTVKMRTTEVDASLVHLEEGMPILVGETGEGVIIMTDPEMPMVEYSDSTVEVVSIDRISYRMNITIDELNAHTSYERQVFGGVPYLVPTAATPIEQTTALEAEAGVAEEEEEEEEERRDRYVQSSITQMTRQTTSDRAFDVSPSSTTVSRQI